jgi:hypothetical protein
MNERPLSGSVCLTANVGFWVTSSEAPEPGTSPLDQGTKRGSALWTRSGRPPLRPVCSRDD